MLIRPFLFLVLSVLAYIALDALLWMPLFLLAVFYTGVDLFKINMRTSPEVDIMEGFKLYEPGVLGHYEIDSDDSFGLFLSLNNRLVFVDIREDEFLSERKKFALFIFQNKSVLESNLCSFIENYPEFIDKELMYIGLHSKDLKQAEVFWEPEGYTILKELNFYSD
jgi:hypothetical protein